MIAFFVPVMSNILFNAMHSFHYKPMFTIENTCSKVKSMQP